ncbi:MAG: bifunctional riboflavin kinase/FAD synthetase [Dehalococcoidales bacterium]|nr:bifunctional riboflavin kinase/FAD synthetase [Dehalococcoidales bacterium]
MQVEEELAKVSPEKDMVLAIGVFDGVHRGHQYLISQLMDSARQQGLQGGVVTFRQHPRGVLSSRTRLPFLTSLPEKVSLLKKEGVDEVVALSFTAELAQLSAAQFTGLLKKYLRMRGLVVGPDFALGREREGDIDNLRRLGQEMDFTITVVPPRKINGEVVSSTAIRNALAAGDIGRVIALTGRPFSLQGQVTAGVGRGSGLSFPTANLEIDPGQAMPADGVYVTWAYVDGKAYPSMTNIGRRPTFNDDGRTVETYILDYQGNLYGHELRIDIVERLRGEKRFDTAEELKKQIAEDVKQGVAILNSRGKS